MKKILVFLLIAAVLWVPLVSCSVRMQDAVADIRRDSRTYLFAGLDDAACNTDVMFLVHYNVADNRAAVVQLPRDTYYRFDGAQNKLNQFCPASIAAGADRGEAVHRLCAALSETLGVPIDGYVAVTTDAFRELVDSVGGVDMELPEELTLTDADGKTLLHLPAGPCHLDGAGAEVFVRYRRGYVMGDIGRVDAQKVFLEALRQKLYGMNAEQVVQLMGIAARRGITDISVPDFLPFFLRGAGQLRDASVSYMTMPGEPVTAPSGLWYYVLNRKAGAAVAAEYLSADAEFDPKRRLTEEDNLAFSNIYNDENVTPRVMTNGEVNHLYIPKK